VRFLETAGLFAPIRFMTEGLGFGDEVLELLVKLSQTINDELEGSGFNSGVSQ
jgi:hypothetical protein